MMTARTPRTITVETPPDRLGRQRFCIEWIADGGEFRKELSKDGKPVGMCRGQYFFALVADYVKPGDVVVYVDGAK